MTPTEPGTPTSAPVDRATATGLLLLAAATFLLYVPSFGHGLVPTWDDAAYVLNRPEVISWWSASWYDRLLTPEIGYPIPLPTLVYAVLHSTAPAGHFATALHVSSAIFHAVASCLAFVVARRFVPRNVAFGVAVCWAFHPAAVEVVAWATNTKTVLYAAGMLLAFVAWRSDDEWTWRTHVGVWSGYVIALASKPEAAVLPVALIAASFANSSLRAVAVERARVLVAMFAVGAVAAIVANYGHDEITTASSWAPSGVLGRIELVLHSLGRVTTTMFAPFGLHPAYYFDPATRVADGLTGAAALVGWILLAVLARRRSKAALALLATAGVLYLPYSQLMFIPRLAADSYVYLPRLFAFAAIGALLADFASCGSRKRALGIVTAVTSVTLGILSLVQMNRWENGEKLFGPVLAENPGAAAPYRHVAFSQFESGRPAEASATLDAGRDAFAAHASFPNWAPAVYEAAGQPNKAADAAVKAIVSDESPAPELARMLLGTLVRAGLPLPDEADARRAAAWSVERHLEREAWLRESDADLVFASYFAQQGIWNLAAPLLASAAGREETRCRAAAIAATIPPPAGIDVSRAGCP